MIGYLKAYNGGKGTVGLKQPQGIYRVGRIRVFGMIKIGFGNPYLRGRGGDTGRNPVRTYDTISAWARKRCFRVSEISLWMGGGGGGGGESG